MAVSHSLAAQMVKVPPAMQETWVQFLGWEDPLEIGTATHSNILAWRTPWTEEPGGLQSMGSPRAGHDQEAVTFTPLTQYSIFLESSKLLPVLLVWSFSLLSGMKF